MRALPPDERGGLVGVQIQGWGADGWAEMDSSTAPELDLRISESCPECGAPYEVGLWDRSTRCGFCDSLLVFERDDARDVYVVSDGQSGAEHLLECMIRLEAEAYRATLVAAARGDSPLAFEPPSFERKVQRYAESLRGELELDEQIDFFAPYRITDQAMAQAVLGRRGGRGKESYLQVFQSEEIERAYASDRYHLRDRGLKIRSFRLRRLGPGDLANAQGRFLPIVEPSPHKGVRLDRSRARLHKDHQVINKCGGSWRSRTLLVYKHFTYARVLRGRRPEHLLFDRQFGTIAARIDGAEAQSYRALEGAPPVSVLPEPQARAVSSVCPNCGWELRLAQRESIHFCETCLRACALGPKGFELIGYQVGSARDYDSAESLIYFPFWVFPFEVRVGDQTFTRISDWLAGVNPDQKSDALRERDPDPAGLYVPARGLCGSPDGDAAFELLAGYASWRQPELAPDRPVPDERARFLGVDVSPGEARALSRYTLVALHDGWSTRWLHARNFAAFIANAELHLAEPKLAAIPLPLCGDAWRPPGLQRWLHKNDLLGNTQATRNALHHSLRAR